MFMQISIAVDALHPLWCYLFIFHSNYGFLGAAWATVLSQWLLFLLLLAWILMLKPHNPKTWQGFSMDAFKGLKEFMKLAVPGGEPAPVPLLHQCGRTF